MKDLILIFSIYYLWIFSGYYAYKRTWVKYHDFTRADRAIALTTAFMVGPFLFPIMAMVYPPRRSEWWNKVITPRKK